MSWARAPRRARTSSRCSLMRRQSSISVGHSSTGFSGESTNGTRLKAAPVAAMIRVLLPQGGRTLEIQRLIGRSLRAVTDMDELGERTFWVDCDVIQADGGTRTASVTGAFVALADAVAVVRAKGLIKKNPLRDYLAAVSIGKVGGEVLTDLCYAEDSLAEVDLNLVMTGKGQFVEVQGTAEKGPFALDELNKFLTLGWNGISALVKLQQELVGDLR